MLIVLLYMSMISVDQIILMVQKEIRLGQYIFYHCSI